MRDTAMRNTHPTIAIINAEKDAWDKNGQVVVLDEAKIASEITRLEAEYDGLEYSRTRANEYPSIADQLDDIYHNGIDAWKATIKVTKDKFPK
mgnify:CR=1 FL=1|tara:strand:+ start:824 stop:1102 length:279 start_codon:yes stop_codon:yes gene_type:complete